MTTKLPRRSPALKVHIRDLNLTPVKRYVDIQRERGRILAIGEVDVDLEQVVQRSFLCDRHRCIQWTPHEKKADARPIIDRSCCSRYLVPVTDLDRRKVTEILPQVRKRLGRGHPYVVDRAEPAYEVDEEFAFVLKDDDRGVCRFVLYEQGQTTCAIHKTCLEEGLPVWDYKPVGCSLWPLALVDYEDEGKERLLLTIYSRATENMFVSSEEDDEGDDENGFACLVDQNQAYEPLYTSMEGILTHLLGAKFYSQLDQKAKVYRSRS